MLVEQMGGTLVTIAKDVKIQVEFNPAQVGAYRLIGYENRMLRNQDFNDDTKDAGEIGAGHMSRPSTSSSRGPGGAAPRGEVDPLRFQQNAQCSKRRSPNRWSSSSVTSVPPRTEPADRAGRRRPGPDRADASDDFKFAAAVAGFGMLLRDSPDKGSLTYAGRSRPGRGEQGRRPIGVPAEFLDLVRKAETTGR